MWVCGYFLYAGIYLGRTAHIPEINPANSTQASSIDWPGATTNSARQPPAQQAGLRGVGRVARALVFVKRDEHMNGISGIRVKIGRLDIIIGSVFPSDKTWADPLTFSTHFVYKDFMQQTNEIKISLKREYDLYSNAMAFYKNTLKAFEQKHQLSTQAFLRKFESGRLGDEADYFDWYAFAKLLAKWRKAQSAIRSAIQ